MFGSVVLKHTHMPAYTLALLTLAPKCPEIKHFNVAPYYEATECRIVPNHVI